MNLKFIIAALVAAFALTACDKTPVDVATKADVNNIANQVQGLQSKLAVPSQQLVLQVQRDARGVAKSAVADGRLRQASACAVLPASLEHIANYQAMSQVANEAYTAACREQVFAARSHDKHDQQLARADKAKGKKLANAKSKPHKPTS